MSITTCRQPYAFLQLITRIWVIACLLLGLQPAVAQTYGGVTFSAITAPVSGGTVPAGGTLAVTVKATAKSAIAQNAVFKLALMEGSTTLASQNFTVAWDAQHINPVNNAQTATFTANLPVGTHDIFLHAETTDMPGDLPPFRVVVSQQANAAPTATLSSPSTKTVTTPNGTKASVSYSGSGSDTDGSVSQLDLLDGATVIDSAPGGVISGTVQLSVGVHTLTLRAKDNLGLYGANSAAAVITVNGTNALPSGTLNTPAGGLSYKVAAGGSAAITISGSGTDTDGTVSRVDLLDNGSQIASNNGSGASLSANVSLAIGSHPLQLRFTDNSGGVGYSNTVTVNVSTNAPPTVQLNGPLNGAGYVATAGGTASVTVSGSAADTDGSVSQIEILDGGTPIANNGGGSSINKSITLGVGSHSLSLRATDNLGSTATTTAVTVVVAPANVAPSVSMVYPIAGDSYTTPPGSSANVYVWGTGSDPDGSVSQMEVLDNGAVIATVPGNTVQTSYPMAIGSHSVRLRATDNQGATTLGPLVNFTVAGGTQLATFLTQSATSAGGAAVNGTFTAGINATVKASSTGDAVRSVELIEGATTLSSVNYTVAWDSTHEIATNTVRSPSLTAALGVGVHRVFLRAFTMNGYGDSSIYTITVTGPPNALPTATFSSPPNGAVYSAQSGGTAAVPIIGAGADSDGSVVKMELLEGQTVLAYTGIASSLNTSWNFPIGHHVLQLRATDNVGGQGLSNTVAIDVLLAVPNVAPVATLIAPLSGAAYTAPSNGTATVNIVGSGGDSDGTINRLELLDGSQLIAQVSGSSMNTSVQLAPGDHTLTLRAVDNLGAIGLSTPAIVGVAIGQVNAIPTAVLSLPASGNTFLVPPGGSASVVVHGSGSDSDGSVSQLEVLDGGVSIKTVAGATLDVALPLAIGSHSLQIRATDNLGVTGVSSPIGITVAAATQFASFNSISATTTGGAVAAGAKLSAGISATISALSAADAVTSVELREGAAVLGTTTFTVQWDSAHEIPVNLPRVVTQLGNLPVGVHQIYLRAYTLKGYGDSASFTVTVTGPGNVAPTAILSSPLSGATLLPGPVTVIGAGADLDGTVVKLELFEGSTLLASVNGATMNTTVTPQSATPTLKLIATDNLGQPSAPASATITIGSATGPIITAPANGAAYLAVSGGRANVVVDAVTQGGDPITSVELRDGATSLFLDTTSYASGAVTSATLHIPVPLAAGSHTLQLSVTRRKLPAGPVTLASNSVTVTVGQGTLMGSVSGVRTIGANTPQLVGWVCQDTMPQALNYYVYAYAKQAAGGVLLGSGVANVGNEPENGDIQEKCHTPGASHHFVFDLTADMAKYLGAPLFVEAQNVAGTATEVLSCDTNSCNMPGSLRIGLTTPSTGDRYTAPATIFMRAQLSGGSGSYDEVSFNINGQWLTGAPDGVGGAYFASKTGLPAADKPYIVYARVKQGATTLLSAETLVMVGSASGTTLAMTTPADGGSVTVGQSASLAATPGGIVAAVQGVRFYDNGVFIGAGSNAAGVWKYDWQPGAVGAHALIAAAYDGSGVVVAQTPVVKVTALPPTGPSSAAPLVVNVEPPHIGDPDAGSLPGSLSVGPSGDASYSIPLVVPPGSGGMQPALALNYSSAGGNGLAGLGWSLGGLASIQRCVKTVAQDGFHDRITFTNADRLCLGGNRLVRADGVYPGSDIAAQDATYWAAGAVYRTELETFTRITRLNNGGFKAELKGGLVQYFGTDANSAAPAQGRTDGKPMQWMLARVEDRSTNYLTWEYNNDADTGEVTPKQIRYGGNTTASQAADLAVRFEYATHSEPQRIFVGGSHSDIVSRLSHLTTYVGTDAAGQGGMQVRDYALSYKDSEGSGRSLVTQIQVSATNPDTGLPEQLPATSFDWGGIPLPQQTQGAPFYYPSFADMNSYPTGYRVPVEAPASLDGSGRSSYVAAKVSGCGKGGEAQCFGQDVITHYTGELKVRSPEGIETLVTVDFSPLRNAADPTLKFGIAMMAPSGLQFVDLDGDGRDDIVVTDVSASDTYTDHSRWGACLNSGKIGDPLSFTCIPGAEFMPSMIELKSDNKVHLVSKFDIDGKGKDCVFVSLASGFDCKPLKLNQATILPTALQPTPYNVYNFFQPQGIRLGRQSMTDLYSVWTAEMPAADPARPYMSKFVFIPGQGVVWKPIDLIQGVTVCFNRPDGLTCQEIARTQSNGPSLRAISALSAVGDLNGDGLTDFIYSLGAAKDFVNGGLDKPDSYNNYARGISGPSTMVVCLSKETGVECKNDAKTYAPNADYSDPIASARSADFAGDGIIRVMFDVVPNSPSKDGAKSELCRYTANGFVCKDMPYVANAEYATPVFLDDSGISTWNLTGTEKINGKGSLIPMTMTLPAEQDKLVRVKNGFGHKSELSYARGNDASVYTRVATVDGLKQYPAYPKVQAQAGVMVKELLRASGNGSMISTTYRYEGAMYDASGRNPFGFGKFTVTDTANKISTTSVLLRDFPYAGEVQHSTTVSKDGKILDDTVNQLSNKELTFANGKTKFPYVSMSTITRNDLSGDALKMVSIFDSYDNWGNLTGHLEMTSGNSLSFSSSTAYTYDNLDTPWLLGLVRTAKVTKADPAAGSVVQNTSYDYDAKGLLWHEVVEPTTPLQVTVTHDRSGNSFGLVNKSVQDWTDPYTVKPVSRNLKDVSYDGRGRFVTSSRNPLGHASTLTYYPRTGALASLEDPNKLKTTWTADAFGRVLLERRPDGNETRSYTKQCQGDCPANAAVVAISDYFNAGLRTATPTLTYLDTAGHVLRTVEYGFNGKPIYKNARYDDQGRLWQTDLPRFADADATLAQTNTYDELGRVTKVETLDDDASTLSTQYKFQGLMTTITNAKNKNEVQLRNAMGRLVQTTDRNLGVTKWSYDAFGNLLTTTDPRGNVVTITYDVRGRKTDLKDPDLGLTHYDVDPVGRTWKQTSARQQVWNLAHPAPTDKQFTRFEYDLADRLTGRYETELKSFWVYDTATNGIGRLKEAYTLAGENKDYDRLHSYDLLGRSSTVTQLINTSTYTSTPEYDVWSRPVRQTYQRSGGTAKVFEQRYNEYGYLARIERGPLVLWQGVSSDAFGRSTVAKLGNMLDQTTVYKRYTARLDSNELRLGGALRVSDAYQYDKLGNVSQRSQYWSGSSFTETFGYDDLNRMTSSLIGSASKSYKYDAAGNLMGKTGTGTGDYVYPMQGASAQRPHAVQSIPGIGSFAYDENGNLTSGAGRNLTWTSFDMPSHIDRGTTYSNFVYGPEHQRTRQDRSDGVALEYAGAQEVELAGTAATVKTYWPQGVGVEIEHPDGSTDLNWFHVDRLGSPIAITDRNGAVKDALAYDPWGKRRATDGSATPVALNNLTDNKGYTGHEMLDQLDLVHMNGRVFDPFTARFVSADPHVTDPSDGQNYNRYSYVLNNPLVYTDPTGFDSKDNLPQVSVKGDKPDSGTQSLGSGYFQVHLGDTGWATGRGGLVSDPQSRNYKKGAPHPTFQGVPVEVATQTYVGMGKDGVPYTYEGLASEPKTTLEKVKDSVESVIEGAAKAAEGIPGEGVVFAGVVRIARAPSVANVENALRKIPEISPTYLELRQLGVKGFQAHHILPQWLGKMLGYSKKDMLNHPATLVSQWSHTGALNPDAMHKAINEYLPFKQGVTYTAEEIKVGLKGAYESIGRSDLYHSIEHFFNK